MWHGKVPKVAFRKRTTKRIKKVGLLLLWRHALIARLKSTQTTKVHVPKRRSISTTSAIKVRKTNLHLIIFSQNYIYIYNNIYIYILYNIYIYIIYYIYIKCWWFSHGAQKPTAVDVGSHHIVILLLGCLGSWTSGRTSHRIGYYK